MKKTTKKSAAKKPAKKSSSKKTVKKSASKKSASKKTATKKLTVKRSPRKSGAKKSTAKTWKPAARDAVKAVRRAASKMYEEEVKTPFQIAMEMLHFYGRAGEQVLHSQAEVLKQAQAKFKKTPGRR